MRRVITTTIVISMGLLILAFFLVINWRESNVLIDDLNKFGIKISTGSNVEIEASSPVGDFTLYHLTITGESMNIYAGNHPLFPNEKIIEGAKVEEGVINELSVKYYSQISEHGHTAEYLFDLSSNLHFPQFLHVAFVNASSDVSVKFMKIIGTIEFRGRAKPDLNIQL